MKRQILLLLCLSLLLVGCGKGPAAETTVQTQPAAIPTEAPVPQETEKPAVEETYPTIAYHKPFTAVSLTPNGDSLLAQDGTTIYRYSSQHLTLVMNDHEIAQGITADFNDRADRLVQGAVADLEAVKADYTGQSDWYSYFCDIRYDARRLDQAVLSLAGHQLFYDGTHRSGENTFALSYDMQTGIKLRLQDVLVEDFSADVLSALIADALAPQAEDLYSDYTDSISGLFRSNAPVDNWYFTKNGLCFFFNPYEIAPLSLGTVLAELPYDMLLGILKDAYFPDEAVEFYGSLAMMPFASADTGAIDQFAEVILDEGGSQYLLLPQGTVLDVSVQTGTWTKDGAFAPDATIFVAEALSQGNALMLQLPKEALGSLHISYRSGSELIQTPWQAN